MRRRARAPPVPHEHPPPTDAPIPSPTPPATSAPVAPGDGCCSINLRSCHHPQGTFCEISQENCEGPCGKVWLPGSELDGRMGLWESG